jgi:ribosomal protein L37AE/L43A
MSVRRVWYPRVDARFCPVCGEAKPERVGDHGRPSKKWAWRCRDCKATFYTIADEVKP